MKPSQRGLMPNSICDCATAVNRMSVTDWKWLLPANSFKACEMANTRCTEI